MHIAKSDNLVLEDTSPPIGNTETLDPIDRAKNLDVMKELPIEMKDVEDYVDIQSLNITSIIRRQDEEKYPGS